MNNITGSPVEGRDFFGRQKELDFAWKHITKGNSLILAAPRRVGNSSFGKKLLAKADNLGWNTLEINLEEITSEDAFIRLFVEKLERANWWEKLKSKSKAKIDKLLSSIKATVEFEGVSGSIEWKTNKENIYDKLKQLLDHTEDTLIMVDEVTILLNSYLQDREEGMNTVVYFLNWLRSFRQISKSKIRWVFCSSIGFDNFTNVHGLSYTFNDVSPFPLGAFDHSTSKKLLQQLAKSDGLAFSEELIEHINLAEFWLNTLDALADTLEVEKQPTFYREIDQKAEKAYLNAIQIDEKYAYPWNGLGNLYQDHLNQFDKAEKAYLNAIQIDKKYAHPWNNLGQLFHYNLEQFDKAEKAYLNAIKIASNHAYPWNNLGQLYHYNLQKIEEAEKAYLKATEVDDKYPKPWFNLGKLYQDYLNKNNKAEKAYIKAMELGEDYNFLWNTLGNLYQDCLKQYKKAEVAYQKAVTSGNELIGKHNLVFLYRDKLHQLNEAKQLFSNIVDSEEVKDTYRLHQSLFALYDKNEGIAKNSLLEALAIIEETLPTNSEDDWFRFAAVTTKLGYNQWLQDILKEQGYDIILSPYFVAIRALNEKDANAYLNSKAVEIRQPAQKIMEMIQRYID